MSSSKASKKPSIGVFKFASCDGCQLSLLDAEDELLAVAGAVDIACFPEASRAMRKGPYDIGFVEGSITRGCLRSSSSIPCRDTRDAREEMTFGSSKLARAAIAAAKIAGRVLRNLS